MNTEVSTKSEGAISALVEYFIGGLKVGRGRPVMAIDLVGRADRA